ncbi:hypothetical protein Tco_1233612 [Tanacetum coccineum]
MRAGSSRMASDININLYNSLFEDATKRQRTSAPTSELGQYMATNFLITLRPEEIIWKKVKTNLLESVEVCVCLKDYLDGVDRVQHETSLEGLILEDVEETIAREEVDLGISPPNTELDECEFEDLDIEHVDMSGTMSMEIDEQANVEVKNKKTNGKKPQKKTTKRKRKVKKWSKVWLDFDEQELEEGETDEDVKAQCDEAALLVVVRT